MFVPTKMNPKTVKVLVVLHGCLESGETIALGAGWDQIAEDNNMVVIYPQVPEGSNLLGCWNWYMPANQTATSGQLRLVMDQIESTIKLLGLSQPDLYVTGISAGATTAAGLMACFPRAFKAGALHSGPSYGLAKTLAQAEKILREGPPSDSLVNDCRPQDFAGSLIVIQGTADAVVNPSHALRAIQDFMGVTNPDQSKDLTDGDLNYRVSDFKASGNRRARLVSIEGLPHAWSGFVANLKYSALVGPHGKYPTTVPFFSDKGPSATNLIWSFFTEVSEKSKSSQRP